MRPRLAVALDLRDAEAARCWAERLHGHADVLKVGLELFAAHGPALVRDLISDGWGVFLDLKLHDIPSTAARATSVACDLGVELVTLHAGGGPAMLEAAVQARGDAATRLVGVTVLTSLGSEEFALLGWQGDAGEVVQRLCGVAHDSGCDGVVASVLEVGAVKAECGDSFLVVTPGIRPAGASLDDQARVATPGAAVRAGADYLVVGRPILRAEDPIAAAASIMEEMAQATADGKQRDGLDEDAER